MHRCVCVVLRHLVVSARVDINRVYIRGHLVDSSSVGVTGAGSATPRRHQRSDGFVFACLLFVNGESERSNA